MNKLHATLESYEVEGELCRLVLDADGQKFYTLLLDIDAFGNFTTGDSFSLLFKESEVFVATKESCVSASNSFVSLIKHIKHGKILSEITFDFFGSEIVALITYHSAVRLKLEVDKDFLWFVKANEITLQKGEM
ncbi:MAG: molybdenum-pterin-binding protein [Sulfurimonadaceae bacterium]|nr:molybdenum-pterin-binding protein [Sulfurimonadaceae bacterium]